jgi:hypothetical protein
MNDQKPMALPTTVPVMPIPVAFTVSPVDMPDGKKLVAVNTQTPSGIHVVFIDADTADALAHHLRNAATRARSGLVMPDPQVIPRINGKHLGGAA